MSSRGITMTGKGFKGMRMREICVLDEARVQVGRVLRLRAKCDEIAPKGRYRSPSISGAPGGGTPCGLDGSQQECEALLAELEREEQRLERMKQKCERIIANSGMKAEMKEFCRRYYLCRLSVERASDFAGISKRTGWNYMSQISAKKRTKSEAAQRKNGI